VEVQLCRGVLGAQRLKELDPILSKVAKTGELKVVGATYELKTGIVEVLE